MPVNGSGGFSSSSQLMIRGDKSRRTQAGNPLNKLSDFAEPALGPQ